MEKTKHRGTEIFFQLTRRHLLVFFKNKVRVMYTLLVPVIIFAVYIFFLRELELSAVRNTLHDLGIAADASLTKYLQTLVDSWMLSGIAALSTITVSLQTNTVFVEDKQNGVNRDFVSSPINKNVLIGSYILFNFAVTLLICLVYLVICLVYLACMNEFFLGLVDFLQIFGILLYATVSSTLMTVFICSFIKTEGTMASLIAVFSTAVGFLIGAYMPLGMLPSGVQWVCAFIPGTYACSLLRYSFMATPLAELTHYVVGVMQLEGGETLIAELTGTFGYQLEFFHVQVDVGFQAVALAVFILFFLVLNIFSGKRLAAVLGVGKKRRKQHGIPAGMQIDGMDGTEFSEKAFDQAEALDAKSDNDENNQNNIMDLNNDGDVTSSEMLTFFSSLLDNNTAGQEARSELFDFARKQAANFYNKYSKDVVSNLEDLVSDIKEKIS